jgi:curved DNA-binding protein CbpA
VVAVSYNRAIHYGAIKTFYDELGVGRTASVSEIKHAFKEVAKVYHPDKNPPEKQAWAHEQMSRFNFIFDTLTNSQTRKEYDELVAKYEAMPLEAPVRRPARERKRDRSGVCGRVRGDHESGRQIHQLRLRMAIGATVGSVAAILQLLGTFTTLMNPYPVIFAFSYFFTFIGAGMTIFAIVDYFGRSEFRRRIKELEERRAILRQRMYEAYAG